MPPPFDASDDDRFDFGFLKATEPPPQVEDGLGDLFDSFERDSVPEYDEDDLERRAALSSGDARDDVWAGMTGQMLRSSCAFFASEVLSGPPEAPYNGRFLVAEHHMLWDDLVAAGDRICVQAPRDHGKTFFFDFALPIWKAAFLPGGKGYIFSATQPQASRILDDIKEEIESNPKLAWLLPRKKKRWGSTMIELANGHKIYARGYGTKIRGAHPDWIVVDDGLNDEDAYSELVRQKHIDYFYTAISNMIIPGGQIVVVGTPFHAADLYADLEQNTEYRFLRTPALDENGNALWPDRYDKKALAKKKREIGSVRFTREFLCQPISDDMSLFPGYLFRGDPVEQFTVCLGKPASYWEELGITRRFVGVDFAISSTTSADYTAVFVIGLDKYSNRWVLDIQRHKGLEYNQQLSLLKAVWKKYDPDLIFLESNQMQRIFGDELIRQTDMPIYKFNTSGTAKSNRRKLPTSNTTSANKNSLEGGVPSLRVLLENGKYRIPRGDEYSITQTDVWINEMKHFTWLEGKLQGVGTHDDTVMAAWIAEKAVELGSVDLGMGAEEGDDEAMTLSELLSAQSEDLPMEEWDEDKDPVEALLESWNGDEEPEDALGDLKKVAAQQVVVPQPQPRVKARPRKPAIVDDDEDDEGLGANLIDELDDGLAARAWSGLPGLRGGGFED